MSDLALDARGLVRRHEEGVAVDHVDIRVESGQIAALLGPSGCGKTTTLRLIAGLDRGEGTVDIGGVRMSGGGAFVPPEKRGIGIVFQDSVLFPHLDVGANVAYGLRADREGRAQRMLELLRIDHLTGRLPHQLSGGEQQRVALARTLAPGPELILLDEPFAHLDASLREYVRDEMIRAIEQTGTSALLVTHDQAEALATASHVVVMNRGRVHQAGSPESVYRRPVDRFTATFVGRAALVPASMTVDGVAESEVGALRVAADTPPGERLAVVRPEQVALVSPHEGVTGRVIRSIFRGADSLVLIETESGLTLEALTGGLLPPGEKVGLRVEEVVATVPRER